MPTPQIVTVTYQGTPELEIDPQDLAIGDGDWVLWQFENIPPGYTPHVYFATPFGPFQLVDLLGSGSILARGKVDLPGTTGSYTYPYTAMLLDAQGVGATGTASLTNAPQSGNSSPNATIRCELTGPGQWSLNVLPANLYLYQGDAAAWRILDVPPGHFVTLAFYESPDPRQGPFTTFFQGRFGAASVLDVFEAVGTNFTWSPPQLIYTVQLRDAQGTVVAQTDPVIDNIGNPPT